MTLVLYNTLTRKKQEFIPLKKTHVGLYTCGPTVYNYAHIGNLRSYVFEDVLKRTLLYNKYKVRHVMNITDVGHLTSDSDAGEDKMLKGAKREKKTVWQVAQFYTKAFQSDAKKLNIIYPDILCRATDHIKEQIEMVKILENKGFTYFSGGNVYFDTSKLNDYGKFARLNLKLKDKSQARVEKDPNKKDKHDFVLWFTKSKFQDQEMKWNSPWGEGYPGWHIECSAMATKYLGKQFDIHCGGIDHIPVHHTNEIAQSEAANGKKPWVKFWLHNEFLVLGKNQKMAKSGENFITLSTLEDKGLSPLDYRYFCLTTSYRKPLMFSYDSLSAAKTAREKLQEHYWYYSSESKKSSSGPNSKKLVEEYLNKFIAQINDDLNTTKVLATLWDIDKNKKLSSIDKKDLFDKFDEVLGLNFKGQKKLSVPKKIMDLAKKRQIARENKDWTKADQLRDEIKKLGYYVDDEGKGWSVKKL